MPSSKGYKRNYKQEAKYHAKPEQKKNRAARNKARAEAIKKHGAKAVAGKDIGHTKRNAKGSTKIQSVKSNRSHGGKIGSRAGKAAGGRKGTVRRRK